MGHQNLPQSIISNGSRLTNLKLHQAHCKEESFSLKQNHQKYSHYLNQNQNQ